MLIRTGAECSHRKVGEGKAWTVKKHSVLISMTFFGVHDLATLKLMYITAVPSSCGSVKRGLHILCTPFQ